jgi:hypothetical protein
MTSAEPYDVCVIGAGAAGLFLTDVLARDPSIRVCLIEAGAERFRDRVEPFVVKSTRRLHEGVNDGRVTALGGATNTWGGGMIRLSHADFEALDGRPDTKWPISFDSIVPHYEAVERLFGFRSAPDKAFFAMDGFEVSQHFATVLPFTSKNFAHRYGPSVRSRSNVTIHCNANITEFVPAAAGASAGIDRIELTLANGERTSVRAKRFVITAGVVNSVLLAKRVFEACGNHTAAAACGSYFHDHVSFPIGQLRPKSPGKFSRRLAYQFHGGFMHAEHYDIESRNGRRPGAYLHLAFETATSSVLRPVRDILNAIQQRKLTLTSKITFKDIVALVIGLPRLGIARYIRGFLYLDRGTTIIARLDLEQQPLKEWHVGKNERSGDCEVSWDIGDEDVQLAATYLPVAREILKRLQSEVAFDFEDWVPDPNKDREAFRQYLARTSLDTKHSSGGLRMGSDAASPVDERLRLRGTSNVFAVTSAVFPRVGTSNPTLTILALGHRLAADILEKRL